MKLIFIFISILWFWKFGDFFFPIKKKIVKFTLKIRKISQKFPKTYVRWLVKIYHK
jgi:hypothetical protein